MVCLGSVRHMPEKTHASDSVLANMRMQHGKAKLEKKVKKKGYQTLAQNQNQIQNPSFEKIKFRFHRFL